jgi:transcriptional antiterminator RfaH
VSTKHQPAWYVVRTNPKQEARAEDNLRAWDLETFAPWIKERRYGQKGASHVIKPLFPQYIFARFDLESMLHKVRFTRGVHSVVTFSGSPTQVDEEVLAIIKSRVGKDGFIHLDDELKVDDRVVITEGPFKNLSGIFKREMADSERVMVLLETLNYQAHVVVDRGAVRKFNQACAA